MTEVLFVLTTIFAAYVVYVTVNDAKEQAKTGAAKMPAETPAEPIAAATPAPEASSAPLTPTPAPTPAAAIKKIAPKALAKKGLRDPNTGDVTTAYTNYRFTKRWIKDALVAEGLLDKVYKNNELDAEIEAAIKAALVKLEGIEKYQP